MFRIAGLLLLLISLSVESSEGYGNALVAKIHKVHDGDTFFVSIDGWSPVVGENIGVRVGGIDTPELNGKCQYEKEIGIMAKLYARDLLEQGETIELRNVRRGSFFRIVAEVYVDGKSLAGELLRLQVAKEYSGKGSRPDWCSDVERAQ